MCVHGHIVQNMLTFSFLVSITPKPSDVSLCSCSVGFATQQSPHRSLGRFVGNPQGSTDGKTEQWAKLGKEVTRKIDIFLTSAGSASECLSKHVWHL